MEPSVQPCNRGKGKAVGLPASPDAVIVKPSGLHEVELRGLPADLGATGCNPGCNRGCNPRNHAWIQRPQPCNPFHDQVGVSPGGNTRFPHAIELLSEGAGILVPHEDPEAIAAALRSLLTDAGLAARTAAVARTQAQMHHWKNVGRTYRQLVVAAAGVRVRVAS
jgi:hypothetical protein